MAVPSCSCTEKVAGSVLMQQKKTLTIVVNFNVMNVGGCCELKSNAGSENAWVWMAFDSSDGGVQQEWFALTLASKELAVQFSDAFELAKQIRRQWDTATDHG